MRSTACVLLLLVNIVAAHVALRSGEWCFGGCETVINYATFNDTGTGFKKTRACGSELRATSLYLCFDEYCEESGREEWLQNANERCILKNNATLPPFDIIDRYGPDERTGMRRMSAEEAFSWPTLNEVVMPDEELFERAFTTLDAAYYEYYIHRVYGYVMYYFWATVVAIGVGTRLISLIRGPRHQEWQRIPTDPHEGHSRNHHSTWTSLNTLLKRYITIPATFNNRCSQPIGWCTIPTRVQSLTIFAFVVLNIIFCTIDYRLTDGNLYWPTHRGQLLRYVSDRTGIIALMNFPLIWLFGMRNNLLIWLTGWGFGTYNNFHRWVARISTVQAIVHSIGYTIMTYEDGGWTELKKYFAKFFFWNGSLATLLMCFLLAFSVYGLRRAHYEIFLTLHIIFSILVLLTMYYHISIFPPLEWSPFIYIPLLTWLLDRALRLARILLFNPSGPTLASTTYNPASHLITLRVPLPPSSTTPFPGSYYYITSLSSPLYAFQSHPFTLAYLSTDIDTKPSVPLHTLSTSSPHHTYPDDSSNSSESSVLLPPPSSPELVFLIRPYSGFTSRLASHSPHSHSSPVRLLLEGPNGHPLPLSTFPSILFIVGGTGIAVALAHLSTLLSSTSSVTTLKIVWAVREVAFLEDVVREFAGVLGDVRVGVEVRVTGEGEGEGGKDDFGLGLGLDGGGGGGGGGGGVYRGRVRVERGRPDVRGVVGEVAGEVGRGRLAVVACGPGRMADETRRACVEALGRGCSGVEYFEESFKW